MNQQQRWGSAPNPEVFKAWRQLCNVPTATGAAKGGGELALPRGINITSSPHRLSLGGLLLSRARFRFAGWSRIWPQTDDCNPNHKHYSIPGLPANH